MRINIKKDYIHGPHTCVYLEANVVLRIEKVLTILRNLKIPELF